MAYMALYRKFRPEVFSDVRGQDHIVRTLRNQIMAGRIGHAYLFSGTRGTGKTTVAKIMARAVNCESPVDGDPCGTCRMCEGIKRQSAMNVMEIDAASNNSVENVREIVDEVRYSPPEGRFKVYIIDEAHMLSTAAFNALLKTLEEPPPYVIFMLATTEPHKLPITILSRCQRYDFKRIEENVIIERLREIIKNEQVVADDKALRHIARTADGAFRDALSLLDQCVSFYLGQELTYDNVIEVLGTIDMETFARLLRYISAGLVAECMRTVDELVTAGRELLQFTTDFTWYLRNLLLAKVSDDASDMLEVTKEQMDLILQESGIIGTDTLIRYIRIFSDLSNQIKYISNKRIYIEVALVKMCRPAMETDYESLVDRLRVLEGALEGGGERQVQAARKPVVDKRVQEAKNLEVALSDDMKAVAASWGEIVRKLPPMLRVMLATVRPTKGEGNNLSLVFTNEVEKLTVDVEANTSIIEEAIASQIGRKVKITTRLVREGKESMDDFPDLAKIFKNVPIQYVD